jgi:hypothetical protein
VNESHNPLVPQFVDGVWMVAWLAVIVLLVVALVSIGRAASRLGPLVTLGWVILAIVVPVVGSIAWLTVGRASVRRSEQ